MLQLASAGQKGALGANAALPRLLPSTTSDCFRFPQCNGELDCTELILYMSRCKKNIALSAIMSKFEYLKLADAVAEEIAKGALKSGDRLPPQRTFAYQREIAVSTASRVYTELLRRGLVIGEVGRGTFVSGEARHGIAASTEPRGARVDFEFNYPILPKQSALIAKSLAGLNQPEALDAALRQATSIGTQAARNIAADYLTRQNRDWSPKPEQLVFTANGRQCMDENGIRPDAVQKAHREAHLSALYLQPIIQNPLGITMPRSRRTDLLRVVEKLDLTVIEDSVYGFLDDEPPLAAQAPDRCVMLDSLSKKVAPGLSLGFVVPPLRLRENIIASVRSGGWTASGFAFAATQQMMADGTAAELVRLKRIDAAQRQKIAAACLSGFEMQANSKSYHLWLTLPPHWRSQTLVAAAARRDIALTPSTTFAVTPGHAPNAIRLALAAPPIGQLDAGLRTLAGMLKSKEEDFDSTE